MIRKEIEVVEPEREALRSNFQVRDSWDIVGDPSLGSIIELTDEEGGSDTRSAPLHSTTLVSSAPTHTAKSGVLETPASLFSSSGPDEVTSEDEMTVDLRGFAYSEALPPIKITSRGIGASTSSRTAESKTKSKKRNRATIFDDDLPSDHVAKLTKCVSCDAQWTTRKSASQKTKHIQSCARKRGFTSDTIRIALLKEVEKIKANNTNMSGLKDKEPCPSENTLLENTVNAGKKTRHRAKKTVESIAVTRNDILDRAKQILTLSHTQPIGDKDEELSMPSTQPFGRSALVEQCSSKTVLFAEASAESPTRSVDTHFENPLTHCSSDVGTASDPFVMMVPVNAKGGSEQHNALSQSNVDPSGTDEQWTHQFRSLILQDRGLHLSILHYEPVHFDVFKELAKASGLVKVTKASLQTFLDAEAIHYYGAEPSSSRRERY